MTSAVLSANRRVSPLPGFATMVEELGRRVSRRLFVTLVRELVLNLTVTPVNMKHAIGLPRASTVCKVSVRRVTSYVKGRRFSLVMIWGG
jgi:hypothetical protein